MRILTMVLLACLIGTAAATPSTTPTTATTATSDANDVVAKVQKFYLGVQQVTVKFRQTVSYDIMGKPKPSDGTLYISKPGKMRWDYLEEKLVDGKRETRKKEEFISDGTTAWVVQHQNKQYIKKSVNQNLLPVAVSFLYGTGDLAKEFNAEMDTSNKWGDKDDLVVKLTPKQPSAQYKNLFLVVAPATDAAPYHVKGSIIIDASNNTNQFMFYQPDWKTPIDDKLFQFDPRSVKDYRYIDGDAAAGSAAGSAVKM
jgi:outer membrane lipoprotein carrier protein